jgi:hypothetical protein
MNPGWLDQLIGVAQAVEADWRRAAHRDDALASIALEHLEAGLPSPALEEVVDGLLTQPLPMQTISLDNVFGQPPFSVYESDKMVMQVLTWHDATTAIHEHNFTGAFGVLTGSSLHSRYRFSPTRTWSPQMMLGDLELLEAEHLTPRAVRPILPGAGSMHSLFHLDRPSISVVLRCRTLVEAAPQLTFMPPGLAVDPFHRPALAGRRRLLIVTLFRMQSPTRVDVAKAHIDRTDPVDAVELILDLYNLLAREEREVLVGAVADRHGSELALLHKVIDERQRTGNLVGRRAKVTDPDQRYLLALLLNAPDRATYLKLAAAHVEDPIAWTLDTLRQLQAQAERTADDEAGLGIDLDEAALYALGALLGGQSEVELLQAAPKHLNPAAIQTACFVLPHMSVLKPLFR